MGDLTGSSPADTYKDVLQVSNSNSGVDTTVRDVSDGEGTSSALGISTTTVTINGVAYPLADGTNGQVITTDGANTLSFATISVSAGSLMESTLQAGENLAKGDIVYMNADSKVYKADASALATASIMGVAQAAIALDASGVISLTGLANDFATLTVGSIYYLSETAGGATTTSPTTSGSVVVSLGVANTTTSIDLKPQLIVVRA